MKITRNSNSANIVQAIVKLKITPVIIPVILFPTLKGSQKQRTVNPNKIKLVIILKWFIQITSNRPQHKASTTPLTIGTADEPI